MLFWQLIKTTKFCNDADCSHQWELFPMGMWVITIPVQVFPIRIPTIDTMFVPFPWDLHVFTDRAGCVDIENQNICTLLSMKFLFSLFYEFI